MSTRQFGIFQTVSDMQTILRELAEKWADAPVLLSSETSEECPVDLPLDGIRNGRSFLISAGKFLSDLEFTTLSDGKKYVNTLDSPVVTVRSSKATESALTHGVYLLTTTRLVGSVDSLALVYKDEEFLRWGERRFRFVKARSTRRETNPGYKYWFLPEADSWAQNNRGHWGPQSTYELE